MAKYIVPILIITILIVGIVKKVKCYDAFVLGAKQSFSLGIDLFPFISAIFIAIAMLRLSGMDKILVGLVSPLFHLLGIPAELCELIILRPFSGSGSLAILNDILTQYGADSYIGRSACIIMGSTETVFYITAVYFANTKIKKLGCALPIALFCSFVGCIVACLLCRVM